MKKYIFWIVFFGSTYVSWSQVEGEWKEYDKIPEVKAALSKYSDDSTVHKIASDKDLDLRFLYLVNEILAIRSALSQCKGYSFMNIGYTSSDGRRVLAGTSPDSVEDPTLRKKYMDRLAQSDANTISSNRLIEIKQMLITELSQIVIIMDDKHQEIAIDILRNLN